MKRPEIDPDRLDFSQFHDLMHPPFTKECRAQPGGIRNHLHLAWRYKWSVRLKRATLCRVGQHRYGPAWVMDVYGDERELVACVTCWKEQ